MFSDLQVTDHGDWCNDTTRTLGSILSSNTGLNSWPLVKLD